MNAYELDVMLCEEFGVCGCFSYAGFLADVLVLCAATEGENWYSKIAKKLNSTEREMEIALAVLDKADLIEHGTALRGSWPTSKGRELIKRINENQTPAEESAQKKE